MQLCLLDILRESLFLPPGMLLASPSFFVALSFGTVDSTLQTNEHYSNASKCVPAYEYV